MDLSPVSHAARCLAMVLMPPKARSRSRLSGVLMLSLSLCVCVSFLCFYSTFSNTIVDSLLSPNSAQCRPLTLPDYYYTPSLARLMLYLLHLDPPKHAHTPPHALTNPNRQLPSLQPLIYQPKAYHKLFFP